MILERLVPLIFLTGGFLIGVSVFLYLRLWERGEEGRWDGTRPGPDEVAAPLPPRRLPRLFLIGFTLCVLTGPLVLWMLIRGGAPVTTTPENGAPPGALLPGASSIGAVLEERLPDAQTQARRHAELLEVIRDLGWAGPVTQGPRGADERVQEPVRLRPRWIRPTAQAALAAVGSLLLLAAGVIVWAHEARGRGLLLGIGICAISAVMLLGTCPDLLAFSLEPAGGAPAAAGSREQAGDSGMPPPAAGPVLQRPRADGLRLIHVARVGPFPDARHTVSDAQVVAALAALQRVVAPAEEGFFLVVGHVDARPLGVAARGIYGTDTGLAQARANWMRARLIDLAAGELVAERVLALPAGPVSIGVPGLPAQGFDDRCVDIYAYGVPR